ncbi:sulfite oxidase heme-binding subunit YedZ [Candidatus Reidiella endopervernicosa]|nr:protein-methionine-sulfoxide reductase heme-binding subunit MsrQ [Candidatus Reidiella endopervernicosa]
MSETLFTANNRFSVKIGVMKSVVIKPLLFLLCLLPLAMIAWSGWQGGLGANPIEALSHRTGDWALRFLLITLAVTPLVKLFGWSWLMRLRRILGLFCFFYATLHMANYVVLDQFFAWSEIIADVIKRPYITVGLATYLLLLPLAVTSTNAMMRRLGKRWKQLHSLIYPASMLAVIHFLWLVKADLREPMIYGMILLLLLGYRLIFRQQKKL